MNGKVEGERRLIELIAEGLASPIEPDDPAFWEKRRDILRQAVSKKRDMKGHKPSSDRQ